MSFVNNLSREKQIEIIAALCEGVGQRAVTRLTGTDRKTVARLALRVGRGCAELHDRLMVGIRVNRLELDEAWSFVGKKQKNVNHVAAVALYVAHYNLCRVHEALKTTPARALGVVDRTWAIGELIDAALATQPITPVPTAPERRKLFTVIDGGRK
jgi:hypothetical protein